MKKISSILILLVLAMFSLPAHAASDKAPGNVPGASVLAAAEGDDEEEEEPQVEPPFTVYLDIDDADAVYLTVNEQPISHIAGVNEVTVDPGDGYIKVHVNDGYAFTKFRDDTKGSDYLQYDYQTMPVTIRKAIGTGDGDPIVVDGDTFTIVTKNMNDLEQFTLTVTVDNAAKAELKVGLSSDILSNVNRTVELHDGVNTVTYSSIDKFLVVSGANYLMPLQSVTLNGVDVPSDGGFNPVYAIQLKGAATAGSNIVVTTAPDIEEDPYSFTADFDDAEMIKYVTKMPGEKNQTFSDGENTFTFKIGDYYEIWTYGPALSCTFNGDELDYNTDYGYYKFYPNNGGQLAIRFHEIVVEKKTFNIYVDDASMVSYFFDNNSSDIVPIQLVDGDNEIEMEAENHQFILMPANNARAYSFTMDGSDVPFFINSYRFTPVEGSEVKVLFHEPVVKNNVTINCSFTDKLLVYTVDGDDNETILELTDGTNALSLDSKELVIVVLPLEEDVYYYIEDGDGNTIDPAEPLAYAVEIVDGMVLNINEIEFDESFVIIIENPGSSDIQAEMLLTGMERYLVLDDITVVPFNLYYDEDVVFAFGDTPTAVYINGVEIAQDIEGWGEGCYCFVPTDGDIVRVYFTEAAPEVHNIAFEVENEVVENFTIMRDNAQAVDHTAGDTSELSGTYYVVIPADGIRLRVTLLPAESGSQAAPFRAEAVGTDVPLVDGKHTFRVDKDMKVVIKSRPVMGINDITVDGADDATFTLQGIRVDRGSRLPAGVYIIGGRKVLVK